jgi:putative oxidoreductase
MNNRLISYQSLNTNIAILLLRIIFGGLMFRYGYMKVVSYNQILPIFGDIIGIGSKLSFHLVIFAEFVCGFFVLIGLFTRLSVVPIFITMVVAYFVAHAKDPFDMKAVAFIFMVLSIVIFILGSGKYSLERIILKSKKTN